MKKKLSLVVILWLAAFYAKAQPAFSLVGSTVWAPNIYNLTPLPGNWQRGAMWSNGTDPDLPQFINFDQCFNLTFQARVTNQTNGADGFAAVFGSNILPGSVNNSNAYLGYYDNNTCPFPGGVINPDFQRSLAVEFDIFNNSVFPCTLDPVQYVDHAIIVRDARFAPPPGFPPAPVQTLAASPTIKDGVWHDYEINWDCNARIFSVTVDGVLRTQANLVGANAPAVIFGPGVNAVRWGFTGGTGAVNSDQEIQRIVLQTRPPEVCVKQVCCNPTFQFDFTAVNTTCSTTVWYVPVDFAGNPLCPPTSFAFLGTGSVSWATFNAYCPTAVGLCIVGYCDCHCCWGFTGGQPNCMPSLGASACCAYISPSGHKGGGLAVGEMEGGNKLAIVPNPNNGSFVLTGKFADEGLTSIQFDVFDVTGKKVFTDVALVQNGEVNKTISLNDNLPNGVYVLKTTTAATNQQLQFTVVR